MKDAPPFSLLDQDGKERTLSEFADQWVLLYFYPKDDTPGCTKEACNFRDASSEFADAGVYILGCSKDTVASHKKFAEKYNLHFPLLSDPDREIHKAYGAWTEKGFMGRPGTLRNSYLINPHGKIVKRYEKVSPLTHSTQILQDLAELQN
ncbi:peroxiredoxin [Candidatus Woesebacteria bacterium]|nr:peroxiredoxin [Candidatus Woesebacteria bacterium]